MLQNYEVELLASLKSNSAYILLLENIQAEVDLALINVENAPNSVAESRAVNFWRALRRIQSILIQTPEHCHNEMENLQIAPRTELDEYNAHSYNEAMNWAAKAQEARLQQLAEDDH